MICESCAAAGFIFNLTDPYKYVLWLYIVGVKHRHFHHIYVRDVFPLDPNQPL